MRDAARVLRNRLRRARVAVRSRWARLTDRPTVTVLMWHRVTEDATRNWGPWRYAVTASAFDDQVARLADRYTVVTTDDLLAFIEGTRPELPSDAAVLTFDDGYADLLTDVLPVLERHDVPATVYISTSLVGTSGPLAFRLAAAIDRVGLEALDPSSFDFLSDTLPTDSRRAYETLRRSAKRQPPEVRERLLETLGADELTPPATMVSPEQVRTLADHELVTVGAHGHDHVPLTTLPESTLRANVETSARRLEEMVGERPTHFSYPYGTHDETVRKVVAEAGFGTAVTTEPAVVDSRCLPDERFAIPRIDAAVYSL